HSSPKRLPLFIYILSLILILILVIGTKFQHHPLTEFLKFGVPVPQASSLHTATCNAFPDILEPLRCSLILKAAPPDRVFCHCCETGEPHVLQPVEHLPEVVSKPIFTMSENGGVVVGKRNCHPPRQERWQRMSQN